MKKLRLTNKAIRLLADDHDLDLFAGGLEDKLDLKTHGVEPFIRIYWAGRLWEQPDISVEAVRKDCEAMTPGELMFAVRVAVMESMGLTSEALPEEGEPFRVVEREAVAAVQ